MREQELTDVSMSWRPAIIHTHTHTHTHTHGSTWPLCHLAPQTPDHVDLGQGAPLSWVEEEATSTWKVAACLPCMPGCPKGSLGSHLQ